MKLRYITFCTFRPLFMDFRGFGKNFIEHFLGKGGMPKSRNSGGTFCHQATTKIQGEKSRSTSELCP